LAAINYSDILQVLRQQPSPTTSREDPTFTYADTARGSSDPNTAKSQFVQGLAQNTIVVPPDLPIFFFGMSIQEYRRDSWDKIANLVPKARVLFPLPMSIIEARNVSYDQTPLGLLGGLGYDAILKGVQTFDGSASTALTDLAKQIAVAGTTSTIPAAVLNGLDAAGLEGVKNSVLSAAGLAINEYMTVMLKGPAYGEYTFQWQFSPNSREESDALKAAILHLKNAQAPSLVGHGTAFFGWPHVFRNRFYCRDTGPGTDDISTWLYRMKPSVLTGCSVDYTPSNIPAFKRGTGGAPESVKIMLQFHELEFWVHRGSNAPLSGGGNAAYPGPDVFYGAA
jgi:hypothetical protein